MGLDSVYTINNLEDFCGALGYKDFYWKVSPKEYCIILHGTNTTTNEKEQVNINDNRIILGSPGNNQALTNMFQYIGQKRGFQYKLPYGEQMWKLVDRLQYPTDKYPWSEKYDSIGDFHSIMEDPESYYNHYTTGLIADTKGTGQKLIRFYPVVGKLVFPNDAMTQDPNHKLTEEHQFKIIRQPNMIATSGEVNEYAVPWRSNNTIGYLTRGLIKAVRTFIHDPEPDMYAEVDARSIHPFREIAINQGLQSLSMLYNFPVTYINNFNYQEAIDAVIASNSNACSSDNIRIANNTKAILVFSDFLDEQILTDARKQLDGYKNVLILKIYSTRECNSRCGMTGNEFDTASYFAAWDVYVRSGVPNIGLVQKMVFGGY